MSTSQRRPLVVLVEDSEDDAFFFRWAVGKCTRDCEVVHLADGGLAMTYLRAMQAGEQPRPDLLFLDLKLPVFSGFEILGWIQAQHFEPPLEVIVLSGSEHGSDLLRARACGAADYCVKPISPAQLHQRLELLAQPPARLPMPAVPLAPHPAAAS
ncbi:response regulator [Opitutus sp. ER46]|uniref:response regulator n=1 Tax=Opitutus sp. ER46 TaxID=2161864 RepID=UPI001304A2FB|nr:response regulator [Opitutus sp. ER46]